MRILLPLNYSVYWRRYCRMSRSCNEMVTASFARPWAKFCWTLCVSIPLLIERSTSLCLHRVVSVFHAIIISKGNLLVFRDLPVFIDSANMEFIRSSQRLDEIENSSEMAAKGPKPGAFRLMASIICGDVNRSKSLLGPEFSAVRGNSINHSAVFYPRAFLLAAVVQRAS